VLGATNGKNIFMEVELQRSLFVNLLQQIYYFPSSSAYLVRKVGSTYRFYSSVPPPNILAQLDTYYSLGFHRVPQPADSVDTQAGSDFLSAAVGLSNSYTLGGVSSLSNSSANSIRCLVVADAAQPDKPATDIKYFLEQESAILTGIVLAWSFVILLSTVALATVVGNYIFYNLKMLSTKMDEYIKDPGQFHKIVIELKELELKGILKRLSDNLISIIEKIEVRKKERKDRINQNYHPLSVGEPKFQERQQLNDYEIIDHIKEQVKTKVEQLKQEANEKERLEKEKEGDKTEDKPKN
jgi:hypothetical protein